MITGKQLRDARNKKNLRAEMVAKAVGINVNTLYRWESEKGAFEPRNQQAFKRLLDQLELSDRAKTKVEARRRIAETVVSGEPMLAKSALKPPSLLPESKAAPLLQFARLIGYFTADPVRRTHLLQLLTLCAENNITLLHLQTAIRVMG